MEINPAHLKTSTPFAQATSHHHQHLGLLQCPVEVEVELGEKLEVSWPCVELVAKVAAMMTRLPLCKTVQLIKGRVEL